MKKDSYVIGAIIGLLTPIIAYAVSNYTTIQQTYFSEKPIALFVIAAMINLIIVRFTFRAGYEKLAKAIVAITFLAMIALIIITKMKV